ncbi:MAG: VWA domain-containing protein [bacterium]|nr:VWA domain-containing protein [bacterium]
MEWDQRIFRALWHATRRALRRNPPAEPADPAAFLGRLQIFANIAAGTPVELVPTKGAAGVDDRRLLLPFFQPLMKDEADSFEFLQFCVLLLATSFRSACHSFSCESADQNILSRSSSAPLRRMRTIFAAYPESRALFGRVKAAIRSVESEDAGLAVARRRNLRRHLIAPVFAPPRLTLHGEPPDALENPDGNGTRSRKIASQAKLRPIELPRDQELLQVNRKEIEDYTLSHNFEKIETADEFDGRWRDMDDDENLDESFEALQEVKLGFRIRTTETPDAVLSADVAPAEVGDMAAADQGGQCVYFDEWDFRRKAYRQNHCRVFIRDFRESRSGFAADILRRERGSLQRLDRRMQQAFQELETVRRQSSGDDPDLDAVIAAAADLRAGRNPDDRLYLARRKRRKAVTLHFLLDLSLSTDSFVADRRVLDIEREALVVFGEVLERYDCRFAVSAFYSRTRNDCVYLNVKSPAESWRAVRDRLGALTPRGYTRIGPALRRSIDDLSKARDEQRWIVMFTDGRPNDYDRYEGAYGNRDVRQAVREAEAAGIRLQAFAVDRSGRAAFQEMLGAAGYKVLRDPAALPESLNDFFLRLVRA